MQQLKDAVEATASASTQISSSSEEMAAGAQEQSSQTAEVAAAMEEINSIELFPNKVPPEYFGHCSPEERT